MKLHKVSFNGRTKGAIGIICPIVTEVLAPHENAAIDKLYDKYEHISAIKFIPRYQPISKGTKTHKGGESWVNWWFFARLEDEQVSEAIEEMKIDYGTGGPGQIYLRKPYHTSSNSYTLILQSGGLDI